MTFARLLRSRLVVFVLAFLSFACLLGHFAGWWTMHWFGCWVLPPAGALLVYIAWQIADMLGYSPFDIRSAATIEEITATLPEKARQSIFSGLEALAETVTEKLAAGEAVHV